MVGALPLTKKSVRKLRDDHNVRSVINCCNECTRGASWYADEDIEELRLAVPDFGEPSLEDVWRALAFINERKDAGTIYVHCKAGRARSVIIVLCYLMQERGIGPDEAQAVIWEARPHASNVGARKLAQQFALELHGRSNTL
jgi:atypical dual specificity phosphatase